MRTAERYSEPSTKRVLLGLALAPAVPALLVGLLAMPGEGTTNAFGFAAFLGGFYGVVPSVVLGWPIFLVLKGTIKPSIRASATVGVLISVTPAALPGITINPLLSLILMAVAAPLGAIGGFTFWAVALRHLKPIQNENLEEPKE